MCAELTLAGDVWGIDANVFGAWGQWAGAVGTFAAVLLALGIAFRDGRQRSRERDDREAAQARTVTAEVAWVERGHLLGGTSFGVLVANHGLEPVLDVTIEQVTQRVHAREAVRWTIAQRGETHIAGKPFMLARVIGPGESAASPTLLFEDGYKDTPTKCVPANCEVTFKYTDAHGLIWRRQGNGTPQRVLQPPP